MGFFEIFRNYRLEIGSLFVLWWFSGHFSGISAIFLTGLIGLIAKYWIFLTYTHRGFLAYILYVLTFAHMLDANQLRASLSLCFLLYALLSEPKSKYTYLWLASLAVIFHYSGIVILILYFSRYPVILILLISILPLGFVWLVLSSDYLAFATVWLYEGTGFVSFTNSFWLAQLFISIICLLNWSKLSEGQKRGATFNLAGVVFYAAFYSFPIVAHRLRELTQLGIFAILFLGHKQLTIWKFGVALCFAYVLVYNLFLILTELAQKSYI
jgi:energy-converting hydrogenase Eha subunit C